MESLPLISVPVLLEVRCVWPRRCVWPPLLDTMVCSAFGLQALQDIERRHRSTGLLDEPAIAQSA
jgi:hypothetical protein